MKHDTLALTSVEIACKLLDFPLHHSRLWLSLSYVIHSSADFYANTKRNCFRNWRTIIEFRQPKRVFYWKLQNFLSFSFDILNPY